MNNQLYQQIATVVEARLNCIKANNDWSLKHEQTLEQLNDLLPSGSGIDGGTQINIEDSTPDLLVFHFDYHHMNDGGYYDGWTAHTLYVKPSLAHGISLRITGRDRNQTKEYLYDVFNSALREEIDFDEQTRRYFLPSMREAAAQFQADVASGKIV